MLYECCRNVMWTSVKDVLSTDAAIMRRVLAGTGSRHQLKALCKVSLMPQVANALLSVLRS